MPFTAVVPADFEDRAKAREVRGVAVDLPRDEMRRPLPIEPGVEYLIRCAAGKVTIPGPVRDAMGAPAHGGRLLVEVDDTAKAVRFTVSDDGDHSFSERRGNPEVTTGTVSIQSAAIAHDWLTQGVWPAVLDDDGRLTISFA